MYAKAGFQFNLAVKLSLAFGVLLGSVLFIASVIPAEAQRGVTLMDRALRTRQFSDQLRELQARLVRLAAHAHMVAGGDRSFDEPMAQSLQAIDGAFKELEQVALTLPASQWSALKQLKQDWQVCRDAGTQLLQHRLIEGPGQRDPQEAVRALTADMQRSIERLLEALQGAWRMQTAAAWAWQRQMRLHSAALGYGVVVVGCAVMLFLMITVLHPLDQFRQAARAVTQGDFRYRISHVSRDELGELARAFNAMADALKPRPGSPTGPSPEDSTGADTHAR